VEQLFELILHVGSREDTFLIANSAMLVEVDTVSLLCPMLFLMLNNKTQWLHLGDIDFIIQLLRELRGFCSDGIYKIREVSDPASGSFDRWLQRTTLTHTRASICCSAH